MRGGEPPAIITIALRPPRVLSHFSRLKGPVPCYGHNALIEGYIATSAWTTRFRRGCPGPFRVHLTCSFATNLNLAASSKVTCEVTAVIGQERTMQRQRVRRGYLRALSGTLDLLLHQCPQQSKQSRRHTRSHHQSHLLVARSPERNISDPFGRT